MKTMQDFKNEESAKQYSLLQYRLSKFKPIGQLLSNKNESNNSINNSNSGTTNGIE